MTTLYASSAAATAAYYTQYLTQAPGEVPGVWSGAQADQLGLTGEVSGDVLQAVLVGRDPVLGTPLGQPLVDRYRADGSVVRAVAGFDATFSAPKSVSVLWALTGDPGFLDVHDEAVSAALAHLERYGATTRVRVNGDRMFPDTNGLTMATFRQSTSRADDPQLHTHAVISAKVQTLDGRWWALDARYLKRHQRMLGGLYQSALRAGLSERFGVVWGPVVNGQAEIAGVPDELLRALSKRTAQVEAALEAKLAEFRGREGRDPSRWERAALTREAAVDTRAHKTGNGVTDLATRWQTEANELGCTAASVWSDVIGAARDRTPAARVTTADVLDRLSTGGSTWSRADVVRTVADVVPAQAMSPARWASVLERAVDRVVDGCADLDPNAGSERHRTGDGRSVWIEPTGTQYTSSTILAEEEHVVSWAMGRQADQPAPSATVKTVGLDVVQADAAGAVAGWDPLVLVEGPAGTGKTTMLRAAVDDLRCDGRVVFGVAPTAKAARVLEGETRMPADTIAKLLHEHTRTDRPPLDRYRLAAGTTVIVDEAGMIGTPTLHHLVTLADRYRWRVVLVGDPRQLQAVGRGGLFAELCTTGRVHELVAVHRFRAGWEATASLQLRHGDPAVFDTYAAHGRITPGSLHTHLEHLAHHWLDHHHTGRTVAITATTNAHVDAINAAVQSARIATGDLNPTTRVPIAGGEAASVGEIVVTRRNDRTLTTAAGDTVRNRDGWTVTHTHPDGGLTVTPPGGHGAVRLPAEYVREHVRLGYAATEHGNQGTTVDVAYQLVTPTTTNRGLYVGATRGRDRNQFLVVTDTNDPTDARDLLDRAVTLDRADTPATVQRRHLEASQPAPVTPEPVHAWTTEPNWLQPWRHTLTQRHAGLLDERQAGHERRRDAARQLVELQPALTAAQAAWQPLQDRIDELDHQLREELRPAMWKANHDACHAGFGHRHRTNRHAQTANDTVRHAEAQADAIRHDASPIKAHLDHVQATATRLRDHAAGPSPIVTRFADQQLDHLERLIDAIDTWTGWNTGRTVTTSHVVASLDTLTRAARHAPAFALDDNQITSSQLAELTQPLATWLNDRSHHQAHRHLSRDLDRSVDFGIDL